ncbi:MAG: pyroglutamyl-peptidase I [Candidatus Lokiarchaeota archaeon]|nr:pyroglutamyl-peptidase I [Candidatus Lokiarchaeota archaeon]
MSKLKTRKLFIWCTQEISLIMSRILITGYEPFDGFKINPSAELAKFLDGKHIVTNSIIGTVLSLDYSTAFGQFLEAFLDVSPDFVLCCGQAGRAAISFERIAINAVGKKPDNEGNIPESDLIDSEGPAAYFSSIELDNIVELLKAEGIPAYVSYHAGTYGCNWLLYKVLHYIHSQNLSTKATFVHVPPLPTQAIDQDKMSLPTMPFETAKEAMEIVIKNL